jgi:small subunit ribosomal protein S6
MNNYETVFILTPVLSDNQVKDAVKKYAKVLKDSGAKIINEESWGLKKLAYKIGHKSIGFYYLIEFDAKGEVIAKLETEYKRDEQIIRFITISLDKHAVKYNEKRRKGAFKKSKKPEKKAA